MLICIGLLFLFIPDKARSTTVHGCPPQCSCHLQRSYYSLVGPYDQVNVLCNVYAADRGADLSHEPQLNRLQADNRSVLLSMEQMDFAHLSYASLAGLRIVSLKLLNNPKLVSVDPDIFLRSHSWLEHLTIMNHDSLTALPLTAIAELDSLKELSIQLKVPLIDPPDFYITNLQSLKSLTLQGPQFVDAISEVYRLKNLERLSLIDTRIGNPELGSMRLHDIPNLRLLNLASNLITAIPPMMRDLETLEDLSLENNEIRLTPEANIGFRFLPPFLQSLNLRANYITSLPCDLFNRKTPLRYLKLDPGIVCLLCPKDRQLGLRLQHSCGLDQRWFFVSPYEKAVTFVPA